MSSHHFVKEGQEPALIILDWNDKLSQIACQLMEWQPKLVVSKEVLDLLLMDGFKPDAVLDYEGEFPDYLHPIVTIEKSTFLDSQQTCTILCSMSVEIAIALFKNRNLTVYTSDYKMYVLHGNVKKILPSDKKIWVYSEHSKEKLEKKSIENQAIDLSPFLGEICIEEL